MKARVKIDNKDYKAVFKNGQVHFVETIERLTRVEGMYCSSEFMEDGIAPYFNRLASYEDTGMSPEKIKKMAKYRTPTKVCTDEFGWNECPNHCTSLIAVNQKYCQDCGQELKW